MRFWKSVAARSSCGLLALLASAALARDIKAGEAELFVRVVDDVSGELIPARLALQASDGSFPGDRLAVSAQRWPHVEAHGVFIAGEATFKLPEGMTRVTAAHGLEYHAVSRAVMLTRDQTATMEFRLKRAVDMKRLGWVSGDLHVHMIHGENQRETSYDDVALTCAANGLDFVAVGQEYVGAGTMDLAAFQARCRAASSNDFALFLGAERPKNILGHQVLLGCPNPFLISEEPPYYHAAEAIHAQGGIAVYVHPVRYFPSKQYGGEWLDFPGNNLARELIFDAYVGPSFDGLSVLSDEPAHADAHQLWFNLLNRGFFVPAFADSDACFDRPTLGMKVPGLWSTYFHIGPDTAVTQEAICHAVRQGRTMATTGPLLQFRIDGQMSGATLPPNSNEHEVTIEVDYPQHAFDLGTVDVRTKQPVAVSRIELIRNGSVVQQWNPDSPKARIRHLVRESEPCWYAARAYGSDDRWQVAVASPIFFSAQPAARKQQPREAEIHGRIYDFLSGETRSGTVVVKRHGVLLNRFEADGDFRINMPLDADITVQSEHQRAITKNLLLDHGPIHRFLWYLETRDMGKSETLDRFELLTRHVEMEFPLGHRMAGCYVSSEREKPADFSSIQVIDGPTRMTNRTVAVAGIMTDVEQIAPGDKFHIAILFRDEGGAERCGPYVVEARGFDPARPTGFGALKKFASVEKSWNAAHDLGDGYKWMGGTIEVPTWAQRGPVSWIDLSIRIREGHGDAAHIGLAIPMGTTRRAITISNPWPTMPLSWPDRNYGIGPLKICNRIGRKAQPASDYRRLHLSVNAGDETFDLFPMRDGRGCPDAEDAMYVDHYLDQVLNEESRLAPVPELGASD